MTIIQTKIHGIVLDYKSLFASEYEAFKQMQSFKQFNLKDKFAEVKGADMIERKLTELPETLWTMFTKTLNDEEMDYIKSVKGQKWLMRSFPVFSSPEKI